MANESAKKILHLKVLPKKSLLENYFPELKNLITIAIKSPNDFTQNNLKIIRDNNTFHLFVRIGILTDDDAQIETIIITFDDITQLLSAQRASAWSDVARRVAHEIKNPLTPIALAAERIKVKYSKQITDDPKNFEKYVATIIKHVDDIGNIVEEFCFNLLVSLILKSKNVI